jgi:UDP-N-acetyl-D-mannosaminuronic acid dehydrogenase
LKREVIQETKKVLIIGLGQIGYNNAEYMKSLGLHVDGFDSSETAVKRALDDDVINCRSSSFNGYDFYILCISTHKPENMFLPHLDGIYEIARRIYDEGKSGALIGIESTVNKGTTAKVSEIVKHRQHVVHFPHRYYEEEKEIHGVNQKRVLGGSHLCCIEKGRRFYGDILRIPLHIAESPEIAELSKIIENSYRFIEISFAEELKMICDRYDYNFEDLRRAVNTKWNVNILDAREGINGHCLPKDSQMFIDLARKVSHTSLIETAKKIDELYRIQRAEVPLQRATKVKGK